MAARGPSVSPLAYPPFRGSFLGLDRLEPRLLLSALQSDDFRSAALNPMWQFHNPTGDCTLTLDGTRASISVPAGSEHDQWQDQNKAPRLMQPVDDVDFTAEVKFESQPVGMNATEGVLVQQDTDDFMRFDFFSTTTGKYRIFAASFAGGSPTIRYSREFSGAAPTYMRVNRTGSKWTQSYSSNGTTWKTAASFSKKMAVTSMGPYAGNSADNPGFTAAIDYFFNTASPIVPEDGPADTTAPIVSGVILAPGTDQMQVTFTTNEPARGSVQYGFTNQYELGTITETGTLGTAHSLTLRNLQPGTSYHFRVQATDASGNVGPSGDLTAQTAAAPKDTAPPVISGMASTAKTDQVQVTFQTDEPARGSIQYGLTDQYELGTIIETGGLGTTHALLLQGLQPGTVYRFRVQAVDASGNTATSAGSTAQTAVAGGPRSDDFHGGTLSPMWAFIDPVGDASCSVDGQRVLLAVAAGRSHDLWAGENDSPRLIQAVENTDFEIEAKFESQPNAQYQIQGLLVEQDSQNILRFDFHSPGTGKMNVFAADISGSSASTRVMNAITPGGTMYMRVRRQGDAWTQSYSYDGVQWTTAATFTRAMKVADVGVFAGNAGNSPGSSPAYTGSIDYVFNTASPISPEDGGAVPPDNTAPTIQNVVAQPSPSALHISLTTDELARVSVRYGRTTDYELGTMSEAGAPATSHSITIDGLAPATNYHYQVVATDLSSNSAASPDLSATTAAQNAGSSSIDVWYGDVQSFGTLGNPQKWVNVLGNMRDSDGVRSATFSVNGGAEQPLGLGPDKRRLENAGDFNVEIDRSLLREGNNTVVIRAVDNLGNVTSRTVRVDYSSTNRWSLPYTADWSTAASIGEVAQVVDGKWTMQNGEVRPVEMGYDRLIAIGDMTWHDYEVTLPVTLHGYDPQGFTWPAGVPALGVVMGWQGHYNWDGTQPNYGYQPLGAIASYQWSSDGSYTELVYDENPGTVAATPKKMTNEVTYTWKVRSDTQNDGRVLYSMKVWEQGTAEPASWDLTTYDRADSLKTGSILLVAHYTDVSFGKVTVTPIA